MYLKLIGYSVAFSPPRLHSKNYRKIGNLRTLKNWEKMDSEWIMDTFVTVILDQKDGGN